MKIKLTIIAEVEPINDNIEDCIDEFYSECQYNIPSTSHMKVISTEFREISKI